MNKQILIAAHAVPALEKTIARLAKVARKLGLDPIPSLAVDWAHKEERTRKRIVGEVIDTGRGSDVKETHSLEAVLVAPATIILPDAGEVKAHGGWSCVGTLTKTDEGLETSAVRAVDLPLLGEYRAAGTMECEHCRAKRNRNTTMLLRDEAGAIKQVGRECADNYLTDVAQVIGELEFQEVVRTLIVGEQDLDPEEGFYGGWSGARVLAAYDPETALSAVVSEIRRHGFVKSREIDRFGHEHVREDATWRKVRSRLAEVVPSGPDPKDVERIAAWEANKQALLENRELTDEVKAAMVVSHMDLQDRVKDEAARREAWLAQEPSKEDLAKARDLIGWIDGMTINPAENDFLASLQDIIRAGFVSERKIALLASLPGAKDRHDRDLKRRQMETSGCDPAPEGRTWVEGEILKVETKDSEWGPVRKMTVELPSGCRVYSTTPSGIDEAKLLAGERIGFCATFQRSDTDRFFSFGSRPTLTPPKKSKGRRPSKEPAEPPVLVPDEQEVQDLTRQLTQQSQGQRLSA